MSPVIDLPVFLGPHPRRGGRRATSTEKSSQPGQQACRLRVNPGGVCLPIPVSGYFTTRDPLRPSSLGRGLLSGG
jgi:hypothetical protein